MTRAEQIAEPAYWQGRVRASARAICAAAKTDAAGQLLELVERFPHMNLEDVVLVLIQRPGSTDLRPWADWHDDGRVVMHGEKAVRLFPPAGQRGMLSVFDVSQTEPMRKTVDSAGGRR